MIRSQIKSLIASKLHGKRKVCLLNLKELPKTNLFLLTHNHYDHQDMTTIRRFPYKDAKVMVPLKLGKYFKRYKDVNEMDWYEEIRVNNDLKVNHAVIFQLHSPFFLSSFPSSVFSSFVSSCLLVDNNINKSNKNYNDYAFSLLFNKSIKSSLKAKKIRY